MLRYSLFAAIVLIAAAPAFAGPYDAAIAGTNRTEANKARDQNRHPAQTLGFFGIKPTMTVVEITPGGGWYTEILGPLLKDNGQLYAAGPNPAAGDKSAAAAQRLSDRFAANPGVYGHAIATAFDKGAYDIAPAGSADAVLTFRNVHNWYMDGFAPDAFKAFFKALKPGGVLGIEEHRLPEDRPDAMMKDSGYMKASYIRKLAEAAGFEYAGSSPVNANPKDMHDYPKGVWTLPPTYAEGDKDRAKYAAIGESDRMTLKFVKPK